jgi:hypothetical protein
MSSNADSRIDEIVQGLGRVLEVAINHQHTAEISIDSINKTSENLNQQVQTLKGQIYKEIHASLKKEIGDSLEKSSEDVFKALLEKFEAANLNAGQCTEAYLVATMKCQQTMRWAIWKVVALSVGVSVITGLGVAWSLKQFLPEKSENISLLQKNKITYCSAGGKKRLCAKIDEKTKTKDGYRFILMKK